MQLDDSVTWDAGKIAFTYSPSQDSTTNVIDSGAARQVVSGAGVVDWIGNTLYKTGKSSGTTYGTVTNSNYSYVHPLGGGLTLMMQSIVAADVRPGDSGAPVFRLGSGTEVDFMGIAHSATDSTYSAFIFSDGYGIFFDFSGAWAGTDFQHIIRYCGPYPC